MPEIRMPTRFRLRFDGEITVRRLCPPQRQTTAAICNGALREPIAAVAARVGVAVSGDEPAELVDGQGLALLGRLAPGTEVFLSGPPVPAAAPGAAPGAAASAARLPPDTALAFAYDARMLLHAPGAARVPEVALRLSRAVEALRATPRAAELLPGEQESGVDEAHKAVWVPARMAELEEIAHCHDRARYEAFVTRGTALAPPLKSDVYCSEDGTSSDAARLAAGAVIDAARAALRLAPPAAFCLVRPPGHHCSRDEPGGFCLINNVAVAAHQLLADAQMQASTNEDGLGQGHAHATECNSETMEKNVNANANALRIAIVDLDVHHGEGTQSIVEPDPRLLFLSLHRYDGGTFYPRDLRGATAYVGPCRNICNVAVDTAAADPARCEEVISDLVFERVVDDIFIPRLQQFRPHIVLVSLGFDAAYGDPLGRMAVEGGFAYATRALKAFCRNAQIGLVVVLEGGYAPEAVAQGVVAVAHTLRLPPNDADVTAFAARRVPKTWHDIRRKLARRQREATETAAESGVGDTEERHNKDSKDDDKMHEKDKGKGKRIENEGMPEDDVLVERHEQWCDRLIARVLAIHAEANRFK